MPNCAIEFGELCLAAALARAVPDPHPKRILMRISVGDEFQVGAWRRRATIEVFRPRQPERCAAFDRALDALIDARLVVRDSSTIEYAHELLLLAWDDLRGWIRENQTQIQVICDLDAWVEERRRRGTLLTGEQLGYVTQAKLSADDLSAAMADLLDDSQQFMRRNRQLRRIGVLAMFVVAVMLAGLSYIAIRERDHAREQAQRAEEQARLAENRLSQAVTLARLITREILPKLDRYPQVRSVRKEILERLQEMLRELGVSDTDFEALREIMLAHRERGDEALHTDNLDIARREYLAALGIAESLVKADPHDVHIRREVSMVLKALGDVEVLTGNSSAARDAFQRSLSISEDLSELDPLDFDTRRDVATVLNKLGDIEVQAGNLSVAREIFQRARSINEALVKTDPGNVQAQHDLASSFDRLGAVEAQTSNISGAREFQQRSLAIAETLAEADPHDAVTQRNLSVSLNKLGDVEMQAGNLSAARSIFQRSLYIAEDIVKADPLSIEAKRDLAFILRNLGNVEVHAGNLSAARECFQRDLSIAQALAEADSQSARAQRDLNYL
ncbi:MAG: tetratricopeptide repeat protein [Deltaproteobacteria bacterium]|nr:tetratricopeptide repeat protein [Deltaproteobacteria bacterium]